MSIPLLKHLITSLLALITLSTTAEKLQPYKYNGKELDRIRGLDRVGAYYTEKGKLHIY